MSSTLDIVAENVAVAGATIVDVGCGTGEVVRWLAAQGARAIGLDTLAMLLQARSGERTGREEYVCGTAAQLPFGAATADCVLYFASLHHVPAGLVGEALRECRRVLKPAGRAVFVEPVALPGSYYEIVRLAEDEAEVQRAAYAAIRAAAGAGFEEIKEESFYLERSFADYIQCTNTFVDDPATRARAIAAARLVTERRAAAAGLGFDAYRYRSTCRLNVLEKSC